MAAASENTDQAAGKSGWPLVLGLLAALAGGAGGFYGVYSGMFGPGGGEAQMTGPSSAAPSPIDDIAFLELDQMVIPLDGSGHRHLRFQAHLEVKEAHLAEVRKLQPRIMDVMNSYLRALSISDLEDSAGLLRLRSQLLRRVQLVTGGPRVNDLLIEEFVPN